MDYELDFDLGPVLEEMDQYGERYDEKEDVEEDVLEALSQFSGESEYSLRRRMDATRKLR